MKKSNPKCAVTLTIPEMYEPPRLVLTFYDNSTVTLYTAGKNMETLFNEIEIAIDDADRKGANTDGEDDDKDD